MGRVISYGEKTGYNDGDYLLLDNGEGGTKRIRADRVGIQLDPTLSQSGRAADAKVVGEEIEGVKGDLSETVTKSLLLQGNLVTAYNENKYNGKAVRGWLGSDGELIVCDGYDWMTTDFIYVKDLTMVSASALKSNNRVLIGLFFLCTYDENGTFIEQIGDTQDSIYNVDDGVSYIRFSYHQELYTDLCVVGNAYNRDYVDYHQGAMDANIQDNLRSIAKRITTYTQNNDLQDITAEFTLYDGYIQLNGKFVSYNGGYSTDYINIFGCGNLFITAAAPYGSNAHYALYDKSKSFIAYYKGTGTEYEFNVNDVLSSYPNANYVRFASVHSPLVLKRDNTISEILQDLSGLRWTGKKWVCVGDSLTEVNVRTTKHYFDYIADATGITTVNMGLSGSGYAKKADTNQAFYQRISNVPVDADVVTIFGSGNDGSSGLDIGSPTDSGTTTLCGCINTTIDTLIEIMPTVSLGIVAPTPWVGQQPSNTTSWMAQYVDAIKTICEYRSIPFLDLYHSSNLRPWTEEGRAACYSKDEGNGVHPDENGHKLIAPRFKAFLETLII